MTAASSAGSPDAGLARAARTAPGDLPGLLARWRDDLAAWAIPDHILAAVSDSPWVLPAGVFARRADRVTAAPSGPSFERAWAALDPPGSVLDIGSGPGTACLPLAPRATRLTAVDTSEQMLGLLAERSSALSIEAVLVPGQWPAVAPDVAAADVVTCHHVVYNAADIAPFIRALTDHASRLVVVEMTGTHPLTSLNNLWLKFHGLERPQGPTAGDLLAILDAMGLQPGHERWRRPGGPDYASFSELVEVTRRRVCLPPERAGEVADALVEAGLNPDQPMDLGSSGRDVMTIWWSRG